MQRNKTFKAINCTTITLISKVQNSSSVKAFLPISCCTILYELISKVLIRKLQEVMNCLINSSHAAFVFVRVITDNILLSHKLIKDYSRKGISPRCMLEIDMQKACNFVECPFLKQMLNSLNFPTSLTNWIMTCIQSVSYSITTNG